MPGARSAVRISSTYLRDTSGSGMAHIMAGQDAGANKSWRSMHNQSNKRGAAGRGVTGGEVHNIPTRGGVYRPPSSGLGPSAPMNSPEKVLAYPHCPHSG